MGYWTHKSRRFPKMLYFFGSTYHLKGVGPSNALLSNGKIAPKAVSAPLPRQGASLFIALHASLLKPLA